jgi:hypothetical protein
VSGSRVVTRHVYTNGFVSCHPFMERVVFKSGGSTRLINRVVSSIIMSGHNRVGPEPDTSTRIATPTKNSCPSVGIVRGLEVLGDETRVSDNNIPGFAYAFAANQ